MIFLKKLAKKVQIEKLACDLLTDFYILIIFSQNISLLITLLWTLIFYRLKFHLDIENNI